MRTCLLAWGTRGDVQPFLALAQGMQADGRTVAVAACDDFEPLVRAAGLDFEPLGFSMHEMMAHPVVRRWLTGSSHSIRIELRHMAEVIRVFQRPAVDALVRLVGQYDGFISGILTADALASATATLGKRHAIALLAPGLPTRVAAAQMFPVVKNRDSSLNRVAGIVGSIQTLRLGSPIRHAVEDELGLPRQGLREQLRLLSATPTLIGVSPHVVPRAEDWQEHVALTGYWTLPAPARWHPSSELDDFLATRPVHIGLGSMPVGDPRGFGTLLEDALTRVGLQATIQGNWVGPPPSSERFLALGDVPHAWLFPRARAVIHHGGAGTTAAAFGAGVPQLAVPHMGDQPYWGRRVAELGCGPEPVRLHELTVDTLTERLRQLVSGTYDDRAGQVGEQVRAEGGVAAAVAHLRRYWE